MRWINDRSGRFPKRLYFETLAELDDECERLVDFVHFRRRGTKFGVPLDDDTLQVLVEEYADLDLFANLEPGVEGETEFRPNERPLIRMSAEIANDPRRRNRLRTGLAHEWFHAAFHRTAWEILWARNRRAGDSIGAPVGKCNRETMIGAADRDWTEFQAGYASCAILMPRSWIDHDAAEFFSGPHVPDEQVLTAENFRRNLTVETRNQRNKVTAMPVDALERRSWQNA